MAFAPARLTRARTEVRCYFFRHRCPRAKGQRGQSEAGRVLYGHRRRATRLSSITGHATTLYDEALLRKVWKRSDDVWWPGGPQDKNVRLGPLPIVSPGSRTLPARQVQYFVGRQVHSHAGPGLSVSIREINRDQKDYRECPLHLREQTCAPKSHVRFPIEIRQLLVTCACPLWARRADTSSAIFDDFANDGLTLRTFKRALIVVRPSSFNPFEPHFRAAF